MRYTTRSDFPEQLPVTKTHYCWHCHAPDAKKHGKRRVSYICAICGRSSGRVLIYDPRMQLYFDAHSHLVHRSCGVFVTRADGKLLLFKRSKFPYLLTIPAGHLEVGEDPLSCAKRETQEEIGIAATKLTQIFEGTIAGDSCLGGADIHQWYTYACIVEDEKGITLDGEGVAWGWYDRSELSAHNTTQPVLYMLHRPEIVTALQHVVRA